MATEASLAALFSTPASATTGSFIPTQEAVNFDIGNELINKFQTKEIDPAEYFANKQRFKQQGYFDEQAVDAAAVQTLGYKPKLIRDTAVGFMQAFYKSPTELYAQNKLSEWRAHGTGTATPEEIAKVRDTQYDREQRQLFGGIGAGVFHQFYKKASAQPLSILPKVSESELRIGAGRAGSVAGTIAGLAASGAIGLEAGLLSVGGRAAVKAAEETGVNLLTKNLIKTAATIGAADNATFDLIRGENLGTIVKDAAIGGLLGAGIGAVGPGITKVAQFVDAGMDQANLLKLRGIVQKLPEDDLLRAKLMPGIEDGRYKKISPDEIAESLYGHDAGFIDPATPSGLAKLKGVLGHIDQFEQEMLKPAYVYPKGLEGKPVGTVLQASMRGPVGAVRKQLAQEAFLAGKRLLPEDLNIVKEKTAEMALVSKKLDIVRGAISGAKKQFEAKVANAENILREFDLTKKIAIENKVQELRGLTQARKDIAEQVKAQTFKTRAEANAFTKQTEQRVFNERKSSLLEDTPQIRAQAIQDIEAKTKAQRQVIADTLENERLKLNEVNSRLEVSAKKKEGLLKGFKAGDSFIVSKDDLIYRARKSKKHWNIYDENGKIIHVTEKGQSLKKAIFNLINEDLYVKAEHFKNPGLWAHLNLAWGSFRGLHLLPLMRTMENASFSINKRFVAIGKRISGLEKKITDNWDSLSKDYASFRELPVDVDHILPWKRARARLQVASQRIFRFLDDKIEGIPKPARYDSAFHGKYENMLTKTEQEVADDIQNMFDEMALDLGLSADEIRKQYITHLFDPRLRQKLVGLGSLDPEDAAKLDSDVNMSLSTDMGHTPKPGDRFSPYVKARTAGETEGLVEDAFAALKNYATSVVPKIYYDPAIQSVNAFMMRNEAGIPQGLKKFIDNFLNKTTKNFPTDFEQVLNRSISPVINKINEAFKGKFYIDPTRNHAKLLVNQALSWPYMSKMWMHPKSVIQNLFQQNLLHGFVDTSDIIFANAQAIRKAENRAVLSFQGIPVQLGDIVTESGMAAQRLNTRLMDLHLQDQTMVNRALYNSTRASTWFKDIGFFGFKAADQHNILISYYAALRKASKSGLNVAEAVKFADEITRKTQFSYSRAARSWLGSSDLRPLSVLTTWTLNYLEYWRSLFEYGGSQAVANSLIAQYTIPMVLGAATGMDFSSNYPDSIVRGFFRSMGEKGFNILSTISGFDTNISFLKDVKKVEAGNFDSVLGRTYQESEALKLGYKIRNGEAVYPGMSIGEIKPIKELK